MRAVSQTMDKKLSDVYENEGEENGDNDSVYSDGSVKILATGQGCQPDDRSRSPSFGKIDSKDLEFSPEISPAMLKQMELEVQESQKQRSNVHGFASDFSLMTHQQHQRVDDSSPFTEELPPGSLRSNSTLSPNILLRNKSSIYEHPDDVEEENEERPQSR